MKKKLQMFVLNIYNKTANKYLNFQKLELSFVYEIHE